MLTFKGSLKLNFIYEAERALPEDDHSFRKSICSLAVLDKGTNSETAFIKSFSNNSIFSENRELMEKDLIKAVSELVPLSRTAKEQINLLKEWSSTGRARSAS